MKPSLAGRTLLLCVVGLGMIQSCSRSDETVSGQAIAVDANIESESFGLALPAIPDLPSAAAEARLRIVRGSVQYSEALLDCSNRPGISQKADANPILVNLKSLIVTELSVPFKVGMLLGPVKLDAGDFSVLLEIFDGNSLVYFGTTKFSVAPGVVTKLDLALQQPKACPKPSGGVVINTVLNNNRPDSGVTTLTFEDVFGVVDKSKGRYHLLGKGEGAFGPIYIATQRLISFAGDEEGDHFPTDSLSISTHGDGAVFLFAAPVTKVSFDMAACRCATQSTYQVIAPTGFEKEIRHSSDKIGAKTRVDLVFPTPVKSFIIQWKNNGTTSEVSIDNLTANLSPNLVYPGPKAGPAPGLLRIDSASYFSLSRDADLMRLNIVVKNVGSQPINAAAKVTCTDPRVKASVLPMPFFDEVISFGLGIHETTSIVRDIKIGAPERVNLSGLHCNLTPINPEQKNQVSSQMTPIRRR